MQPGDGGWGATGCRSGPMNLKEMRSSFSSLCVIEIFARNVTVPPGAAATGVTSKLSICGAEFVVLVAKNGNQWTLQRGYGLSSPTDHSSTALTAHCMSRDFFHGVSNWSWTWDTARDPHCCSATRPVRLRQVDLPSHHDGFAFTHRW